MKNVAAMTVALRVLTALTDKRRPDPGDIKALYQFAPQMADDVSLDELARIVIHQEINRGEHAAAMAVGR